MGPALHPLALLADSVIPLLCLILVYRAWRRYRALRPANPKAAARCAKYFGAHIVAALAIVYGSQWLDRTFSIWPRWGLDYSTHTAFMTALTLLLIQQSRQRGQQAIWGIIFFNYLILMYVLQYHTAADMITTAIWTLACSIAAKRVLARWLKT